jgi:hypothetical protein
VTHYYYFVATLPTLLPGAAAPMTSAEFLDRAARYLPERELAAIRAARLSAPDAGESAECIGLSPLLDGYYAWDRAFRTALAKLRAARLGRPASVPPAADTAVSFDTEAQARAAFQAASPLEGEFAIERARWATIESHLGYDVFSFEAVAAYRLRLQSLERTAALTAERGEEGYRAAYAAILGAANTIDLTGDPR